ncbi:MAG TPA: 3-hydroxyacyl-CoA dehydrogenase NAD-binding domain-containing protein [Acidobacteriaceae bacterium]|jgi:3-hydroxyacyl-CoA dehydrogenase|nr:3-hydroxyacyl-CoA dehydrogenase NAD-binding domain-containing protein [Acidobacteriaceae bacterium]
MAATTVTETAPHSSSSSLSYPIRRVAVLGAGTMGSRIAALMANAGFPVLLLDMAQPGDRNGLGAKALEVLKKSKPAALAAPEFAARIAIGNFDDDLPGLRDCDWVIEAVAENLEIKRSLLARVAPHLRPDALLTTNTSGLPVAAIAEGLPQALRRRWFGTHFFNPPRYMQLVEIIATPETDPAALVAIARFADIHLGKSVVPANDRPNFIANRIGAFSLLNTLRVMQQQSLTIEEVDVLTGKPLGWPKTGTFRLADMVGLDVLGSVVRNFTANTKDERSDLHLPAFLETMLERKWFGDKTGQGFYKKERGAKDDERLTLDLGTFEYRPAQRPKFPALDATKPIESLSERIRALLGGNPQKDKAAAFYWQILPDLWLYAAARVGEITDSVADIDRAMRTGFNWELGPFEMWDAAGVADTAAKLRSQSRSLPPAVEKLLATPEKTWYRKDGAEAFDARTGRFIPVEAPSGVVSLARAKRSGGVVRENPGASLIDVGDGIACIEFHTKMNALGGDIVSFVRENLNPASEAVRDYRGFVITNDAANFSAGANLVQLLLAAQDEEWDEIDAYIAAFQEMTQAIKFCPAPVVVAPFGLALGGGAEVTLHAAVRQPHLELYMGLVETGVGLIPAGGGCKEMTLRAMDQATAAAPRAARSDSVELHHTMRTLFENIALAKVSTSAYEARDLHLLRPSDRITMNRDRVLYDAKLQAVTLADTGYTAPLPRTDIPAPGDGVLAALKLGVHMLREGEQASDHDVVVTTHLAEILCGGVVTPGTPISEQYLLDLERQHFLSLCGERKTQERIAHTLKTGKPLRN